VVRTSALGGEVAGTLWLQGIGRDVLRACGLGDARSWRGSVTCVPHELVAAAAVEKSLAESLSLLEASVLHDAASVARRCERTMRALSNGD
jgi:hypothetical protein